MHGSQSDLLRLQWAEGKLAWATLLHPEAERAFSQVRGAFIAEGLAWDAALVTLDLAALLAEIGRWREVPPLVAEVVPICRAQGVEREALAALLLLAEAREREQAAEALVAEVRRRLAAVRR